MYGHMITCVSSDIILAYICDYVRDKCDFCVLLANKNIKSRFYVCKLVWNKFMFSHRENDWD